MSRVTFKGVVEKEELLKIVKRLWHQEQKAESGKSHVLHNVGITDGLPCFKVPKSSSLN